MDKVNDSCEKEVECAEESCVREEFCGEGESDPRLGKQREEDAEKEGDEGEDHHNNQDVLRVAFGVGDCLRKCFDAICF